MRIIIVVVWFCIGTPAFSQFTISGRITTEIGTPLGDVHVHLGTKTTATNSDGFYQINILSSDSEKIVFSAIGFQTQNLPLQIGENTVLNVVMKEAVTELQDVTVKQSLSKNSSNSEQKIGLQSIEKASNLTLADLVKQVSGVSVLKTGSTLMKPVINGLHSSRVPIINQNIRLEDQQWGTEHAPNIDVNTAGTITIIKGASALQYGSDAIGGLIIIEPEPLRKDTLQAKTIVTLDSNGRAGTLNTVVHKGAKTGWSWKVLGTSTYSGDRETPEYILSNSGNRTKSLAAGASYTKDKTIWDLYYSFYQTEIGIIKAAHIGNVPDLYAAITNLKPNYTDDFTYSIAAPKHEVQHHFGKVSYTKFLNEKQQLQLHYAFQWNNRLEFDVRRSASNTRASLDLALATHSLSGDYAVHFGKLKLKAGSQFQYQDNFSNPATGVRPLIPSYSKIEAGIYGIATYKHNNTTTFEAGFRYDKIQIEAAKYYLKSRWNERNYSESFSNFMVRDEGTQWFTKPKFGLHNYAANLGFKKAFHHDYEWIMNVSIATRTPNPAEWFSDGLHHATGQIELGDLRIQQEKAYKWNTTVRKQWQHLVVEVQPFVNRISNFIYLQPTGFETTIRGAFPVWEYQQTEALLTGIDFATKWEIAPYLGTDFTISGLTARDLTKKGYLIDMPTTQMNHAIRFQKKKWNAFQFIVTQFVSFTKRQYPNFDFYTDIVVDNSLTQVLVPMSKPPKGYHLLNLYSEMCFPFEQNKRLTVAFSVNNATNKVYRDYLNRQRFFADELGRSFQIQLKFNY